MRRARRASAQQWLTWFGVLVMVCAAMLATRGRLDKSHITLALLLVVLLGSAAAGRAVGISLAFTAFLAFDALFLPPYNTLVIADPLDWLALIAFLVTGVTAAELLARERHQADLAERRADEIDRIATLGAENLNAPRADEALDRIASVICEAMGTDTCAIHLRQADHSLRAGSRSAFRGSEGAESGLLRYTVDHAQPAVERADGTLALIGQTAWAGTDEDIANPLTELRALGIPLSVRGRVVGALRLASETPFSVSNDKRRVLVALSYYAALGAERVRLAGAEEEAESLRRADRLKDALLAAVSHDLRTPLTSIKGIANEVWRGGDPERAQVIEEEADRLTRLVDDLLEMSQINAGGMRMLLELNTVDDLIGAALDRVEGAHGTDRITVDMVSDGEILVGRFDFAHTMRALTNLLENAVKYSPAGARVLLRAHRVGEELALVVEDEGPGVATEDLPRIFEPFYRGRGTSDGVRGTGLGLSIAKQLAEAQGGSLIYEPRPGGGSRFTLSVAAGPLAQESAKAPL